MRARLILLLALLAFPFALQLSGAVDFFNLQWLKDNQQQFSSFMAERPLSTAATFILVYTIVCALPLPAVALLTVAAGMLFGFTKGLVVVSFASAIGATLAFWLSRYIGQTAVHRLFGRRLGVVDLELERAGFLYATSLRLVPGVPFFVANIALGLSTMRTGAFYLSTQLGMLIMLSLLVNAGHNLSRVNSLDDILSPQLMLALGLMAVVPLSVRLVSRQLASRRANGAHESSKS